MTSPLAIAVSALGNFKPDASVYAGGGAAILTVAIGAILVALNVTVPFVGVPLTMTMVTSAAVPIGHIVSSLVPATYNQQLNQFAQKLGVDAEHLKDFVPQIQRTYPQQKDGSFQSALIAQGQENANINKS